MKPHQRKRCRTGGLVSFLVICFTGGFVYCQSRNLSSTTTSVALADSDNALRSAILQAPVGSLGPKGSDRNKLLYYDFLFLMTLRFGANAKTLLEVGCASDPFAQYLQWMDQKSCLAPYFASYHGGETTDTATDGTGIAQIKADFMEWDNPSHEKYDLVLCNQVLEHVPDPKAFLQKLIKTSQQTTIVSVPYKWINCGKDCGHLHHGIDLDTLLEWAHPYKPVHHAIVTEDNSPKWTRRIFAVFQH